MSRKEKNWWIVGGILIVVYALFPVAWIVSLSFKAPSDLANGQFLPTDPTSENYQGIFSGAGGDLFLPALRNSFGICLIATAISCVLAMFAAYAIARLDFRGRSSSWAPRWRWPSSRSSRSSRPCSTSGVRSGCTTPGQG
jgi:multiple sugar transport system permease protein